MATLSPTIDFGARITRLRGVLDRDGLDAAVLASPANIAYLAGFQALIYSRPIYLVVTPARTELVVPGLEEEHAGHAAGIDQVTVYYEHPEKGKPGENAPDTLADLLLERGARRVGLEYASAPIALRERLERSGLTTGDVSADVIRMRLIKEPAEIALMRQAAALARIGVMATLEAAAPGQSQLSIESIGTNAILEAVPQVTPNATINLLHFTTSGPETSLPHLITTTRSLTNPDLAIHSRQVSVDGERAELERTFAIGAMDAETRRVFDAAEEAQLAAIAAIRPASRCATSTPPPARSSRTQATASIRSIAPATDSASRPTRRPTSAGMSRTRWKSAWSSRSSPASTSPACAAPVTPTPSSSPPTATR